MWLHKFVDRSFVLILNFINMLLSKAIEYLFNIQTCFLRLSLWFSFNKHWKYVKFRKIIWNFENDIYPWLGQLEEKLEQHRLVYVHKLAADEKINQLYKERKVRTVKMLVVQKLAYKYEKINRLYKERKVRTVKMLIVQKFAYK